jgi:hypothetical protein
MNNNDNIEAVNQIVKKLQKNDYKLTGKKEDRNQFGAVSHLKFEDENKTKSFLMEIINSGNDIRMLLSINYKDSTDVKYIDTEAGYTLSEILEEVESEIIIKEEKV